MPTATAAVLSANQEPFVLEEVGDGVTDLEAADHVVIPEAG
jgi:hypothetical protein